MTHTTRINSSTPLESILRWRQKNNFFWKSQQPTYNLTKHFIRVDFIFGSCVNIYHIISYDFPLMFNKMKQVCRWSKCYARWRWQSSFSFPYNLYFLLLKLFNVTRSHSRVSFSLSNFAFSTITSEEVQSTAFCPWRKCTAPKADVVYKLPWILSTR